MTQIRNDGLQTVRGSGPEPADISPPAAAERRQAGAALPGTVPETAMAEPRMKAMRTAIERSGGILLLDNFHVDGSRLAGGNPSFPNPAADQNVRRAITEVKEAFDALDALTPGAFRTTSLDGNTSQAVERAFDALNALDERLAAFESERGVSAASQSLRDASMARLCELSRFVGAMQAEAMTEEERQQQGIHGFEALRPQTRVRDMLGDLAATMHGNDPAAREVALRAEKLFHDLEALKAEMGGLSSPDAARAVETVRRDAAALIDYVDTLLAPPPPGQSKSLPGEPALFRAIGDYAKAALTEMDGMLRQTPRDVAASLLRGFYSPPDARLYDQCPLLSKDVKKTLLSFQKDTVRQLESAQKKSRTRDLTGTDILSQPKNRKEALKLAEARAHLATIRYLLSLTPPFPNEGRLRLDVSNLLSNNGLSTLSHEDKRALGEKLLREFLPMSDDGVRLPLPDEDKEPYLTLCASFEKSLLRNPAAVIREAGELAEAVNRSRADIPVTRYLPLFFEKKARLSTLVNAAMYNIPPEHLEARLDSARLQSDKVLGQGAVNTVRLCRYADERGNPLDLVFKPEAEARLGFSGVDLSALGYADSIRIADLNTASSTVAGLLGTPQVLANSSLGFFGGRFGLFMSHAPGHTPGDLARDPESTGFNAVIAALRQNGRFGTMLGNLQRELCRLEWADLLCGQGDRHSSNYLVAINPEDGSVTVTGIDNDASFSERMIGATTVDVTDLLEERSSLKPFFKAPGSGGPFIAGEDGKMFFSFAEASTADHYARMRGLTGMNQMFVPRHIDEKTYDKLMKLNVEDYRKKLEPFLSEAALDAAVLRLESAKALAREVAAKGGVLRDGDWEQPDLLTAARDQIRSLENLSASDKGYVSLGLEFFARDFPELVKLATDEAPGPAAEAAVPEPAVQTP